MATWLTFRNAVKAGMTDLTATDELFAMACAEYVRAKLTRDWDRDNILSKSHENQYKELRKRLLGFSTTLAIGSTLDTAVKKLLTDVTASNDLFASAAAAYVKAMIAREVDHDPELYKSYYASFVDMKRRLLGFTTTLVVGGSLDTAVKLLLPVDADRQGVTSFVTQQIKNAHLELTTLAVVIAALIKDAAQDIGSLSVLVDKLVREASVDLQSYIECYRTGQETIYTDDDVTAVGSTSRGAMPDEGELLQAFLLESIPALTTIAYKPCDLVSSNGRTYKVVSGGTLSAVGGGLTSTDGTLETLGGLTFVFFYGEACIRSPIVPEPWYSRSYWNYLRTGGCADRDVPAMLAIDPQAKSFYLWPGLNDEDHTLSITWSSPNINFVDGDVVPFTEGAQNAVREYALSKYYLHVEENAPLSRAHQTEYLTLRSRLYLDCQDRKRLRY